MAEVQNGTAMIYMPTLTERIWRKLGFRYHLGDEPPDADLLEGWMITDSGFNFGWADRLRLLVSGRLRISIVVHMDTKSPAVTKTRLDWHVLFPGER